ncbi:MAG TPA: GTP-binding protein [Pirellula sp.]|nr:GTP-binding protein [Pirellula sp.]
MSATTLPRFVMLGGFLGAGKTTTIAKLARYHQDRGQRVAIVTNDQATDLVDTSQLRAQGFEVGEVAGSCFCCNFNELTATVERLSADQRPHVVLAEPVGSCTDLVSTVIRPLQQVYTQPFDIAPYGVIIKPSHGVRILRGTSKAGFSPQAEYIFRKQIEEADFVVINRIDELKSTDIDELSSLLDRDFGGRPILRMSAKTGEGFAALCEFLDQRGEFGRRVMDVDYDIYAQGESDLGWLNSQIAVSSRSPIDLDKFLIKLLEQLQSDFAKQSAETAHLKAFGLWEGQFGVANLISSFDEPVLSLASNCLSKSIEVVVNARVAIAPEILASLVRDAVAAVATAFHAVADIRTLQSFRPGRPVPTHRIPVA